MEYLVHIIYHVVGILIIRFDKQVPPQTKESPTNYKDVMTEEEKGENQISWVCALILRMTILIYGNPSK